MLIGVDLSGVAVTAALIRDGDVLSSLSAELPASSAPADVLDALASVVRRLAPVPESVGIAIPGQVGAQGQCYRFPNAPAFEGVELAQEVGRRLDCPIAVENRATAAALAERLYGHGREHPNLAVFTLGLGVGGGVVLGGQIYPGSNGFGGELGHLCVDTTELAPLCACGQRGCLEAFAGVRGLLARFAELGGRANELDPLIALARRGDRRALLALEGVAMALGRAVALLQNVLDLNAIVLSGRLASDLDLLEARFRQELRKKSFVPLLGQIPLLCSELGDTASVIGAAHLLSL